MNKFIYLLITITVFTPQVSAACNTNANSYQTMSKRDWLKIKQITKDMYEFPVHKFQIDNILNPPSNCKTSAAGRIETCTWTSGQNCRQKVKAQFRDSKLVKIKKSGF